MSDPIRWLLDALMPAVRDLVPATQDAQSGEWMLSEDLRALRLLLESVGADCDTGDFVTKVQEFFRTLKDLGLLDFLNQETPQGDDYNEQALSVLGEYFAAIAVLVSNLSTDANIIRPFLEAYLASRLATANPIVFGVVNLLLNLDDRWAQLAPEFYRDLSTGDPWSKLRKDLFGDVDTELQASAWSFLLQLGGSLLYVILVYLCEMDWNDKNGIKLGDSGWYCLPLYGWDPPKNKTPDDKVMSRMLTFRFHAPDEEYKVELGFTLTFSPSPELGVEPTHPGKGLYVAFHSEQSLDVPLGGNWNLKVKTDNLMGGLIRFTDSEGPQTSAGLGGTLEISYDKDLTLGSAPGPQLSLKGPTFIAKLEGDSVDIALTLGECNLAIGDEDLGFLGDLLESLDAPIKLPNFKLTVGWSSQRGFYQEGWPS